LEGVTPDKLRVKELLERAQAVQEIILAFNPDLEGETTSIYLKNLLKLYPLKVTRLAKGLPMGGVLEYADEATLANAIKGRTVV
ncbi:toprim domain-containing protein, partial [Candidatus Uhrbacteria bacterium]|nr:toprim domain-containing protein [Candidatus Uhrbacteria bacterium]